MLSKKTNIKRFSKNETPLLIKLTTKAKSPSKKKNYFIFWVIFALLIVISFFLYLDPEVSEKELMLIKKLGELEMEEEYLNLRYNILKEDIYTTLKKINDLMSVIFYNDSIDINVLHSIKNSSYFLSNNYMLSSTLRSSSIFSFLPHLLSNMTSLIPLYHISKGRVGVTAVLGVPTVKRSAQSYLISTLNDLICKMSIYERNDTLIVVYIAEIDEKYVSQVIEEIKIKFRDELESGLIDIISPAPSYYPDFGALPPTLSDSVERVRWRSKQSLDFAFLMMYSFSKGMFYIQLEDDILVKQNYLTIMKEVALTMISNKQKWFVLDFCQLGFIGKMFRCVDLPWIIQFVIMFFNDKPVDWLLHGLIHTKVCNLEKNEKECKKQKEKLWIHYKPSLFQHIGTISSLKGKVQKLKDKHFGKISLFYPHQNPSAVVSTSIKTYKDYTLQRAYNGETFFWGQIPKAGDWISFQFQKPIKIKRYRFKSGNLEYPSDKLYSTSVYAYAFNAPFLSTPLFLHKMKYIQNSHRSHIKIGTFDNFGVAEGFINKSIEYIFELKLVLHNNCNNWVILSEILIEEQKDENY